MLMKSLLNGEVETPEAGDLVDCKEEAQQCKLLISPYFSSCGPPRFLSVVLN